MHASAGEWLEAGRDVLVFSKAKQGKEVWFLYQVTARAAKRDKMTAVLPVLWLKQHSSHLEAQMSSAVS
jgi:hypothetical protein